MVLVWRVHFEEAVPQEVTSLGSQVLCYMKVFYINIQMASQLQGFFVFPPALPCVAVDKLLVVKYYNSCEMVEEATVNIIE